ncbi:hypothetical protein BJV82DRAFT_603867 [Fennellomyces sp. T-0311]|nr:hypothetical protein BJV82DRAFT_603867 [Fennellomyces sp. T-0311]
MDLNICLYCEKRLSDDSINFCSLACQAHEASKSYGLVNPSLYQAKPQQQSSYSAYNTRPASYIDTTPSLSYHRRRSLYYPKDHPRSFSSSSSLSSLTSSSSSSSDGSSSFLASYHYAGDPVTMPYMHFYHHRPADNVSMLSESSSDMDSVHTIL